MNTIVSQTPRMSEQRARAYRILLSVAVLHLKWDLACVEGGLSWLNPWKLLDQIRAVRKAACRARAFHNLALFAARDFDGFHEDHFWEEIDWFHRKCQSDRSCYRDLLEACLADEPPDILSLACRAPEGAKK